MEAKLAKTIAEMDYDFKLLDDYQGKGNCVPTYAVIVPSLSHLIQNLIEDSESLENFKRVGRFKIDNLGHNYILY